MVVDAVAVLLVVGFVAVVAVVVVAVDPDVGVIDDAVVVEVVEAFGPSELDFQA